MDTMNPTSNPSLYKAPDQGMVSSFACVLGEGPLQRHLAGEFGLPLVARPVAGSETPLVVLAERASDVQAIAQVRSWAPIRVVIAWCLPESALLRLLDLDLPVLIGMPTKDRLEQAVLHGLDGLDRAAERRRVGRLAAVEAALAAPGRSDAVAASVHEAGAA
jgi:hypothetical protein